MRLRSSGGRAPVRPERCRRRTASWPGSTGRRRRRGQCALMDWRPPPGQRPRAPHLPLRPRPRRGPVPRRGDLAGRGARSVDRRTAAAAAGTVGGDRSDDRRTGSRRNRSTSRWAFLSRRPVDRRVRCGRWLRPPGNRVLADGLDPAGARVGGRWPVLGSRGYGGDPLAEVAWQALWPPDRRRARALQEYGSACSRSMDSPSIAVGSSTASSNCPRCGPRLPDPMPELRRSPSVMRAMFRRPRGRCGPG